MIEISVRGIPAPQGSKRHVGHGRMIESSAAVKPWREAIRAETQRTLAETITGPIEIRIWFFLKRPAGHYRTGRYSHLLRDNAPLRPCGAKDDLDKLCRAVLDGLTEGGAWKDDGQVADLDASKYYAAATSSPGCKIWIQEITG